MPEFRLFLYNAFNNKRIGWLIIFLATAAKSILTGVFTSYETDKSFYLLVANNLAEGKGLTIPISFLNNPGITENIYLPSANSPLYSILAAPLVKIFPGNYYLVTWIIESCSWLLLFIILYKILTRLLPDYFWANMFILFSGFFLYNIELSSSTKDVLSTALIFAGVLQCMRLVGAKQVSWLTILLSSFLFLLPGVTKSLYIPLAIGLPSSIFFIGLLSKDRRIIRTGQACILISLVLFSAHYFYFHWLETNSFTQYREFFTQRWFMAKGGDDYIRGIYFENLLRLYPFVPASLFNLDTTGAQVRDHLPFFYRSFGYFLYIVNAIGIAGLVSVFFIVCKRFYRKTLPASIAFLVTGLVISFGILAITCFLSLRYHAIEYKGSTDSWTFVYENRPYFFIMLFLQLSLFLFLFSRQSLSRPWRKLKWVLLMILTLGFLHGFYFVVKNATRPASVKTTINKLITSRLDSVRTANPGKNIWLATEMPHLDWYAKLDKIHVANRLPYLNDSSFKLPPGTILLTAIIKDESPFIGKYLERPGVSLMQNYNDTYLLFIEHSKE